MHRKRMTFLVRFGDGDEVWLDWSPDIHMTLAFETFCVGHRFKMLQLLLLSGEQVKAARRATQREVIPESVYGSTVYINLRSYGADWYDSRDKLPDKDRVQYYVRCQVKRSEPHNARKCVLRQDVFNSSSVHDAFYMTYFGNIDSLVEGEVELTDELCVRYNLLV